MQASDALIAHHRMVCSHSTITMDNEGTWCADCREEMVFLAAKTLLEIQRWAYIEGYSDHRHERDARFQV